MTLRAIRIAAPLLAATLATQAAAQDDSAQEDAAPTDAATTEPALDTVVATVNGRDIVLGHMLLVRAGLSEQYQQLPDNVLWEGILDQLVRQEVLAQSDMAEETPRVTLALENERRALVASEAVNSLSADLVSEEEIEAAYEEQFAQGAQGTEYNAAHILVETEEEAQTLVSDLEGGADFSELARERSTGPSGPNGGSLGWFAEGEMVGPFEETVAGMEAGEISDPVETQFGWHVIRLNETREKEAPALSEVRDQIAEQLQTQAVQERIVELVSQADVDKVDSEALGPAALSQFDLLEN
ncbi:peptidylprolyl isomerase [Roseivivax sediminis]|uniref:Parvulin-like PPIase n=1 Tax=Roseivivax sediminis TaxID=936889 RepID=A0A1I1U788_9RHOB|nr:peptidylprolyl isomerase [Roseivivax sediminis]SFD66515.1 peptidyl-prolyl cis-trans isomerase C [Roseivivax sediminis]